MSMGVQWRLAIQLVHLGVELLHILSMNSGKHGSRDSEAEGSVRRKWNNGGNCLILVHLSSASLACRIWYK